MLGPQHLFTPATNRASIQEAAGTEAPRHIFNPQSQDTSLPGPLTLLPVPAQTSCSAARGGCSTPTYCSFLWLGAFLLVLYGMGQREPMVTMVTQKEAGSPI